MRRRRLALAGLALLSGCTVGPEFHAPAAPRAAAYRAGGDGGEGNGAPQLAPGANIAFDWWRAFGSRDLDALVARALANSPQVEAAQQRLRAAQAELRAGYGAYYPAVGASFDATRQKYSPSRVGAGGGGSVFSLFTPSVTISYALDLFGGNRRAVEGLKAKVEQQQQIERGTYLTLASTVVSTAIARAAYHDQTRALARVLALEEQQLQIVTTRAKAGTVAYSALLSVQGQVEAGRTALDGMRQKAEQADDLLAILLGDPPAGAQLPDLHIADFHLPASVPLTLPSALVRQRPDILAAEAAAHAANADIGVATAAMLPNVTLGAGLGSSSNNLGQLFGSGSGVWNYGAAVTQPLFQGGALRAQRAVAQAEAEAALADYRQTVLAAFAQVSDTLAAIQNDSDAAQAQTRVDQATEATLRLAMVNGQAGILSEGDVLPSEVEREQARAATTVARAAQLQDCVALFAALGGGWWH